MRTSTLLSLAAAAALAATMIAGCGGGSTGTNGNVNGDAGATGPGPGTDAAAGDAGSQKGTGQDGGGLPDGAAPPQGSHLVTSGTIVLDGVTTDDYAIYTDINANTVSAVALAGGTPIALGAVDTRNDVTVSGKIVLIGTSSQQGVGSVTIWKSGAAAATPLTAYALQGVFSTSADDASVLYIGDVDATQSTGTIYVAGADGTGAKALVTSVDLTNQACSPSVQFSGTYAVASYCLATDAGAANPDAGVNVDVATVSSFGGPAWALVPIAANVEATFSADTSGKTVVVAGATGLVAYPITGGTAVPIDATGTSGAYVTSDGAHVLYTTTGSALMRASTSAPASPTVLAAAGTFASVLALSPDEQWAVGSLSSGQGFTSDLYLASTATAGTPAALSTATTGALGGDPFTTDSSHAIFFTSVSRTSGTLNVSAVTAGATPTQIGTNVTNDLAAAGAKVVFSDNYNAKGGNGSYGTADLRVYDASGSGQPALLVTQADAYVSLSTDRSKIVYSWSYYQGALAGLWVMPLP